MVTHKIHRYSTIRMVNGVVRVLAVFSCGPCKQYARHFMTREGREEAIAKHTES